MSFSSADAYGDFVEAVKHRRRFIYEKGVREFLLEVQQTSKPRIKTLQAESILWRAQLGFQVRVQDKGQVHETEVNAPWFEDRMKPTSIKVGEGRANPRGIAYLYLANSSETAGAEMRPWLGALLSISEFRTKRDLQIVDCTIDKKRWWGRLNPDGTIAAWGPEEFESIVWGDISEAMSRPYSPDESSLHYVPTQIVSESLRDSGADGMAYRSLLAKDGTNFVLFDPCDADPINFTLFEANEITYTISQCDNTYFPAKGKPEGSTGRRQTKGLNVT